MNRQTSISFTELEENFEHFVDRAAAGESFVITVAGRPVAKLVAYDPTPEELGSSQEST